MTSPGHFWLASALTLAAVAWLLPRVHPARAGSGRRLDLEAAGLLLLTLLAWRWPGLCSLIDFNPDESQLAAGALTLLHDPVYWRSVDGTTSGPINFYALVPFLAWDGLPPVFATRLGGLIFLWGSLTLTFAFLRRACGTTAALLGLLPVWLFAAVATDWDFVHCSSEQVSLPLIAGSALLLQAAVRAGSPPSGWRWHLSALLAGLLPWAKLQSALFAAALTAVAMILALRAEGAGLRARLRALTTYLAWVLVPTFCFFALAIPGGQLRHLYASYIVNNLIYASARPDFLAAATGLGRITLLTGYFPLLLATTLTLAVLGVVGALACRRGPVWLLGAGWGGMLLATYTVLKPGLPAPHYLFYLLLPCAWLAAASIHHFGEGFPRLRPLLVLWILAAGLLLPLTLRHQHGPPDLTVFQPQCYQPDDDRLGAILGAFAQQGDTLAVWGWAPRLFVTSRLPQGTRDGNAGRQIQHSSQRDNYYRPRFIEDLQRNRPTWFVDAVGPGRFEYQHRAHLAHDAFADMAAEVRAHYRFVADCYNARIYVRADLPAQRPEAVRRLETSLHETIADGSAQWSWPLPPASFPTRYIYGRHIWHMQTPAEYVFPLQGDEQAFYFTYGLIPQCYVQGTTDGAELRLELLVPQQPPRILFQRFLDPRNTPLDRGAQRGHMLLPASLPPGASLRLRALPGPRGDISWDWVFFGEPRFTRPLHLDHPR